MSQTTETNSLEVRWFETGSPPEALAEWLSGFGPTDTATRTDLYLLPLSASFNLKLRGGGDDFVEMKRRLGAPRRQQFAPDVTGCIEQWYKWSFRLDGASELWTTDRTGLWVPVEKRRTLCVLDSADARGFDDLSHRGVAVHAEVTEVSARSETAWTCGLEAAGPPALLDDALATVGSTLFGEDVPLTLSTEQSLGYAAWLRRLAPDSPVATDVLTPRNR